MASLEPITSHINFQLSKRRTDQDLIEKIGYLTDVSIDNFEYIGYVTFLLLIVTYDFTVSINICLFC
jgi:hypothetical protein